MKQDTVDSMAALAEEVELMEKAMTAKDSPAERAAKADDKGKGKDEPDDDDDDDVEKAAGVGDDFETMLKSMDDFGMDADDDRAAIQAFVKSESAKSLDGNIDATPILAAHAEMSRHNFGVLERKIGRLEAQNNTMLKAMTIMIKSLRDGTKVLGKIADQPAATGRASATVADAATMQKAIALNGDKWDDMIKACGRAVEGGKMTAREMSRVEAHFNKGVSILAFAASNPEIIAKAEPFMAK